MIVHVHAKFAPLDFINKKIMGKHRFSSPNRTSPLVYLSQLSLKLCSTIQQIALWWLTPLFSCKLFNFQRNHFSRILPKHVFKVLQSFLTTTIFRKPCKNSLGGIYQKPNTGGQFWFIFSYLTHLGKVRRTRLAEHQALFGRKMSDTVHFQVLSND